MDHSAYWIGTAADATPTNAVTTRNRKHCWTIRLLLVVGISALPSHMAHCCLFPVFMQTNITSSLPRDYSPIIESGSSSDRYTEGDRSSTSSRDWRGRVTDQHVGAGYHVTVFDDIMTVFTINSGRSAPSYSYQCIELISDDRFVVSYVDETSTSLVPEAVVNHLIINQQYTCVQFVRRASNVVQLRIGSRADHPSRDLCSYDVIKLDPWLLFDQSADQATPRRPGAVTGVPCALRGGFGVRMYDRTGHQGSCDSRRGETRLESDCERHGDGMYFYFRHASCVPVGLYMYATQRTVCIANWVTGSFGFIVLRHDRLGYMWLLRYPSTPEESFTAHLFVDLVADHGERISETSNYIRLDTVRDTPRPATSLCVDEHDVCATWRRPCTSGPQMSLACPRTCGVCNATRPYICDFPSEVIGKWHDGGDFESVEFGRTTLTVKPDAGSRLGTLRCIRWSAYPDKSTSGDGNGGRFRNVIEEMLVTETADGCRPRYVCVRILRKSPSVIYFRLSAARQWPLTSLPNDPIDCRSFSYDHDLTPPPGVIGRYAMPSDDDGDDPQSRGSLLGRGRHGFRFFVAGEPREDPVTCRLPGGQLNNYSVSFRCASDTTAADCVGCAGGTGNGCGSGADCLASLLEAESGTALRLTLSGCSHQTNRTEYVFDCRQSTRLVPSKDLVVVVSSTLMTAAINSSYSQQQQQQQQESYHRTVYHCWVFPNGSPSTLSVFYLFDGSHCDDAMRVIDFTETIRLDGGQPRSSSSSPSSLALATFLLKPRRSPREEEDLAAAAVSVASGSRTVHALSGLQRNAASGGQATDSSGVSSTTFRSSRISTTSQAGFADSSMATVNAMVVVVTAVMVRCVCRLSYDNL